MNDPALLQALITTLAFLLWAVIAFVVKTHAAKMKDMDERIDRVNDALADHELDASKTYVTKAELQSSLTEVRETMRSMWHDIKTILMHIPSNRQPK